MPGFKAGDKVQVKKQSSSPFRGRMGTVICTQAQGLAITYEVSFEQSQALLSPDSRFFEYDLERAGVG